MTGLLAKLEALVDELTGLVKEERARRNQPWPYIQWNGHVGGAPDFYGPRGTEFRVGPDHPAPQGGVVINPSSTGHQ